MTDCDLSDLGRLTWRSPDLAACASLNAVVVPFQFPEVVPLNIGGAHFTTRLSTLRRYEDTMLAAMFSGRHYIPTDSEGRYFIDRDGTHFGYVCLFLCDQLRSHSQQVAWDWVLGIPQYQRR